MNPDLEREEQEYESAKQLDVTSITIAFTPAELECLRTMVLRYVPLSRQPEMEAIRVKVLAAIEVL